MKRILSLHFPSVKPQMLYTFQVSKSLSVFLRNFRCAWVQELILVKYELDKNSELSEMIKAYLQNQI